MIIVHAAIHEGRMFVWGESSEEEHPAKKTGSSKGRQETRKATRHPFEAVKAKIVSVLVEAVPKFRPEQKRFQDLAAWLPTKGGQVIPSSPLIGEVLGGKAKTTVRSWTVSAYPLKWLEAVDFLCACAGKKVITAGLVIGDDLAFWSQALRFAGSLVARQHYLPSVEHWEDDFRALWQPIYLGDDSEALAQLAQRMPPAARSLCDIDSAEPLSTPAIEITKAFIGGAVDHLVRSSNWNERSLSNRGKQPSFESTHDAWLHALKSPDNRIIGERADLSSLAEQVREWSRPIAVTASSPLRLCFRLEEPAGTATPKKGRANSATESWYVRYLLQPLDDLSLLIPVKDAWNNGSAKSPGLNMAATKVTEYLLTSLGQASAMCPNVASSLKDAQPTGYTVDAQGAHDFLTEKALLLQQTGYGVLLPSWWTGKGTKLRLSVSAKVKSPKMKASTGLSLGEIVQFDWELAIGDQRITLQELQALAKLKAPLVKVRGQWVEINPEEIEGRGKTLVEKGIGKGDGERCRPYGAGSKGVPSWASGVQSESHWMGWLIAQSTGGRKHLLRNLLRISFSPGHFALTKSGASLGLDSLAGGEWEPALQMTWGWGKPFRLWP